MKTALQELIEWMDEQGYTPLYNDVRRKATELLEKEREQAMKLTGKAKELFEKWAITTDYLDEFNGQICYDNKHQLIDLKDLPASMQWGVYQDFADSLGYEHEICVEWYEGNKWWAFVGYTDVYSPTTGEYKTRQEARNAAIEKLNEIINQNE